MINIYLSDAASDFILHSLQSFNDDSLTLRIAVYPGEDCFNYGIGFDQKKPDDIIIPCGKVKILVHKKQISLLDEASLDYVEMEDGHMNLIVMNPCDKSYIKPKLGK